MRIPPRHGNTPWSSHTIHYPQGNNRPKGDYPCVSYILIWGWYVRIQSSIVFSENLHQLQVTMFATNISRPQQNSYVEFSSSACFMFWLWWSPASYPSFLALKIHFLLFSLYFSQNHKDFLTKRIVCFVFSWNFCFYWYFLFFISFQNINDFLIQSIGDWLFSNTCVFLWLHWCF